MSRIYRVLFGATVVALFVASGALPAAAASTFPHAGSSISTPTTFKGGIRSKVISTKLTLADPGEAETTGWIDVFNSATSSTKLTISFFAKPEGGKQKVHKENQIVTVAGNTHLTIPTAFEDLGLQPGDWELGVLVTPDKSITLEGASQTVLAPGDLPHAATKLVSGNAVGLTATPKTVLNTDVDFGSGGGEGQAALVQGWINVVGGASSTTVKVDYWMDDVKMGSISQIVGPDRPASIPVAFVCDGAHGGEHTFALRVATSSNVGAVVRSGSLSSIAMPGDQAVGNASLSGGGNAVSLNTKAKQLLQTKLEIPAISDAWMGGWLTFQNTSAKPRMVTVQAAMGDEAEGPALVVTVPAHGLVAAPFGFLCDGEDAGTLSLDVMVAANGTGVSWTGGGQLGAWAVAP